jgi:hypothetical protein
MDSSTARPSKDSFFVSNSAVRFVYPYTPLLINKGVTNTAGVVTSAEEVTLNYELDQSEYQDVFNPKIDSVEAAIYRGLKIRLMGTGGPVQVSSSDYIEVSTNLEFEFFIDEDFND